MEAAGIVLMKKENGVLSEELGSFGVEEGINCVYKAYVENDFVNLFLTTPEDVTDDEYTEIFDKYNLDNFTKEGFEIEEIDDEYNPVWCIKFKFEDDNDSMRRLINDAIRIHLNNLSEIIK